MTARGFHRARRCNRRGGCATATVSILLRDAGAQREAGGRLKRPDTTAREGLWI